jgi:hypothetical protein
MLIEPLLVALQGHPAIRTARLAGSRGRGDEPTPISDWDLEVEADDFESVAEDLPALVGRLGPLAQQWDPYASEACYMLMLPGAVKVDIIFPDVAHGLAPPWEARPDTLVSIDRHFWDWILWVGSKLLRGQSERVQEHLELMFKNLLQPMGVEVIPGSIEGAVTSYLEARSDLERRFNVTVPRQIEATVLGALRRAGYAV